MAEKATPSGLSVPSSKLDFGETWESSRFQWILPITNCQGRDVEISDFVSSCGCSEIQPRSLVIPAGQTREMRLTLDLTPRGSELSKPQARRDFSMIIWPRVKGDSQNGRGSEWKIRGRIRSTVYFEAPSIDFGRQSEAAQPFSPQKVTVTSFVALSGLTATCDSNIFQVRVDRKAGDPRIFELTVTAPRLPIGPIESQLAIVAQVNDGQSLPAKFLAVSGRVLNDIQISPPDVLFGARELGETAEETLTLHSLTDRRFKVIGMSVQGEGLTIEKTSGDEPETAIRVKQKIVKAGSQVCRAVFRLQTVNGTDIAIDLPVSYLGLMKSAP